METTVHGEKIHHVGTRINGWNLYVPGCRFGSHDFKRFNKQYVYVELPESENRVFLRTATFLEVQDVPGQTYEPCYVLVHDIGTKGPQSWDPPKGQVEYKEYETIQHKHRTARAQLRALLKEGVRREVEEESRIKLEDIKGLREIPNLVVGGHHADLPNHFQYQYHIFEGKVSYKVFQKAKAKIDNLRENPHLTVSMPKDIIEKDEVALWSPSDGLGMIMDGDPKKIMQLYMRYKNIHK